MPQLDGLRAIAVIAVLIHHYMPAEFFLNSVFHIGPLGVRFFFVLSGFLITSILLKYKQRAQSKSDIREVIKNFYARRFIRLFPIYYLLLFVSLAVNYELISQSFWWHFFHLSNIYFSIVENWGDLYLLPHFWSLAVEEQFYLIWPIVVLFVPIKHFPKMLLGTIGFSVAFRYFISATGIGSTFAVYLLPFSCLDALCLGGLLTFVAFEEHPFSRFRKLFLRVCFWIGIPSFIFVDIFVDKFYQIAYAVDPSLIATPLHTSLGPLSASLVFVWIVEKASWGFKGPLGSVLQSKPLLYIGKISYGIYLYHLLTAYFINKVIGYLNIPYPDNWFEYLILFLVELGFVVVVASISWHTIEQPINQFKDRFPYLKKPHLEKSVVHTLNKAIVVERLGKRFSAYHAEKPVTFMQAMLSGFRGLKPIDEFWALRDISFEVAPGEMLGMLGHNGAGKSTLLQLLGQVSHPTKGRVHMNGRVGALLDLGAGFHGDLTGRENVFVSAIVAGLSRREVARRFDTIVEFAALEQFINQPVRTYSTGMMMRLAFSVAVHTDPDILLVDEFLSVGDLAFQAKCLNRIEQMKLRGCAIVLVSHDVSQIERLCDRALWLKHGTIMAYGDPTVVTGQYKTEMRSQTQLLTPQMPPRLTTSGKELRVQENRFGSLEAEITNVRLLPTSVIDPGHHLSIELDYRTNSPVESAVFSITISQEDGKNCLSTNTLDMDVPFVRLQKQGTLKFTIERIDLKGGHYFVDVGMYKQDWSYAYDYHWHVYPLTITATAPSEGFLHPPMRVEVLSTKKNRDPVLSENR